MSFKIYTTDDGRVPGLEYMAAGEITPKIGMGLVVTAGKLAVCGATAAPTYISMCEKEAACSDGDIIPVIRVGHDMIFETEFSAAASAIKVGNKVTLADGLAVTATTTNGVAEIVYMDGTEKGDMCRVRF